MMKRPTPATPVPEGSAGMEATKVAAEQETALVALVRAVGQAEILPRFRRLAPGDAAAKTTPDDLVTAADIAAERALATGIGRILPSARVVGEEAVSDDPALLDGLEEAPLSVLVDPVDGTWNFAHGLAVFGTMVAVLVRGVPVWGMLHDPVFDDWVVARRGGGAWFARPGAEPRRLRLDGAAPASAVAFMAIDLFGDAARPNLAQGLASAQRTISLRCSCHEYRTLLTGGAVSIVNAAAKPWDHAAGLLAVAEAGGVARRADGGPPTPARTSGPLLVARSDAEMEEVLARYGPALRQTETETGAPEASEA